MLIKPITFTGFDGVVRTENFYFNFTRAEVIELEVSRDHTGFAEALQAIVETNNARLIMGTFKEIILKSVGERTADGRHFNKSPDIMRAFENSAAYDALFMELVTNANAGAEFVNGILPKGLETEAKKILDVPLPTADVVYNSQPGNLFENTKPGPPEGLQSHDVEALKAEIARRTAALGNDS